jgi:hypothetical protein
MILMGLYMGYTNVEQRYEGANSVVDIKVAVKQAKEEYRNELETSLETATGENYDGKTWDELNEAVGEMSLDSFIEPMFGFFEEYCVDFNETPVDPPGGEFPIDPEIPIESEEGGDENVTE